ncbi:hypothetical protein K501DRAFT_268946 [Backusella circina FSU 941]|nr:hypothetical protein K501DRAFT_268946 [Backusella circina FSU 941]
MSHYPAVNSSEINWGAVRDYSLQSWQAIGWFICLGLLVITWIVSIVNATKHLMNYYNPRIQRHKLRVIVFPPFYSTLVWFVFLRYDFATVIMFFAKFFEALAVCNLYSCLKAYLEPFRKEAGDIKEPIDTKIMFRVKYHLTMISSLIAIVISLKGVYCEGVYSFQGAYVYLTIINAVSLFLILMTLFTYLDVFRDEWKRGAIRSHGMFWTVKAPILIGFAIGEVLLSVLVKRDVIHGTDGTEFPGAVPWSAAAVKNAIFMIILSVTMIVDCFLMYKYFGSKETTNRAILEGIQKKKGYFAAFFDAYIAYIPEFIYMVFCCGYGSYKLMKKRKELVNRGKGNNDDIKQTDTLLNNKNGDVIEFRYNSNTNQLDSIDRAPTTHYLASQQQQEEYALEANLYNNYGDTPFLSSSTEYTSTKSSILSLVSFNHNYDLSIFLINI